MSNAKSQSVKVNDTEKAPESPPKQYFQLGGLTFEIVPIKFDNENGHREPVEEEQKCSSPPPKKSKLE